MNDHEAMVRLKEHREALRTAVRAALFVLSKEGAQYGRLCDLLRSSLTLKEPVK